MSTDTNIGGRLDRLPLSRFHWKLFTLLGIAMFFDGYDLLITGVIIPFLRGVGKLDPGTTVYFASLPLVAAALGSVASGFLGDHFGRRKLTKINVAIYGLGSVLCALAPDTTWLIAFRIITGFGLGMQIVTGYSYMNEMTPTALRGRFQAAMALIVNSGLPIGALLGAFLVPLVDPDMGWRILFFFSVIPLFVLFLGKHTLPESPRWLASKSREAEADAIVSRLESEIVAETGVTLPPPKAAPPPARDHGWHTLMSHGIRSRFAMTILLSICHLTGIYIFVTWLPTILIAKGLSFVSSFTFSAVTFSGSLFGPLIAVIISDRLERRWTLVGASIVAAAAGLIYAEQDSPTALMLIGFVLASAINFISAVALATYIPEILPTGVRLRGVGTSFLIGRLSSAASPFVVAAILPLVANPLVVVSTVGGLYLVMAGVVAIMGPNTTRRTLESLERPA